MFGLWSLCKVFFCVRKDCCYFSFACKEDFSERGSLRGPTELLSRNPFAVLGG